jgi:hypothetical protein
VKKIMDRLANKGQGMVEFAIVFPLLLLVLFGIIEFGRFMFTHSAAIAASREAARYGSAIQDIGGGIPQFEDCQGIREAAKRIGKFAGIEDGDITIQYSNESGVYSTSCPPGQEVGLTDSISVTVNTSISPLTPFGNFNSIPVSSSSSRTILRKIRLGESGTGAGSLSGALTDVNFKTTAQTAEETKGIISAVLELNQIATDLVTIPFSVTGTAVQGVDYLITSSPVTINPGGKTVPIFITLINDAVVEGDESLFIGIDPPTNATKGPQSIHMVTILDPPYVTFTTISSIKSESTTTTALMIELSKGSSQDVSIPIVSAGTATWGAFGDYQTTPNPVVIDSGSLTSLLTITIHNDLIDEDDEIAVLGLGSPTNALLGAIPIHTMTIIDDDDPPEVAFFTSGQVVSEEIGTFTTSLTLAKESAKTISVPYSLSGTTIPADYVIHNPSPLIFPPGTKTVEINMSILEGDGWEVDETLIITLQTPTNAVVGSPGAQTIIITESSVAPTVYYALSSQSIVEGDRTLDIYVQMSNAWSEDVIVPYTISGNASVGDDYLVSSSPLVIPVGYTQGSIQVQINEDVIDEDDEQVVITMGDVVEGIKSSPTVHTIQIVDNDSPPEVNFYGSHMDGIENGGTISISVNLSLTSVHDVSIPLILSGSASEGADYSISTFTLVIPAGNSGGSILISFIDDSLYDPDENIIIDLGVPTNATLGSATQFTVDIEDDEIPLCNVGTHLLTVGTDSLVWSITNEGEALIFTGGSITWPESTPNQPRLLEIQFSGATVFSGSQKPPSYSYFAWEGFSSLDTTTTAFFFDGSTGTGDHVLVGNFQNTVDGSTCSLIETYNKP